MKKKQDGYVLAYVLIVLVLLLALAAAVITISYRNLRKQVNAVESSEVTYEAEGKIEQFVSLFATETFTPEPATDGNGEVVTDDNGNAVYPTSAQEELIQWATESISIDGLTVESTTALLADSNTVTLSDDSSNTYIYTSVNGTGTLVNGNSTLTGSSYTVTENSDGTVTVTAEDGENNTTSITTYYVAYNEEENDVGTTWTWTVKCSVLSSDNTNSATTVYIGEDTYTYDSITGTLTDDKGNIIGYVTENSDYTVTVKAADENGDTTYTTYDVVEEEDGTEIWTVEEPMMTVTLKLSVSAEEDSADTDEDIVADLTVTLAKATYTDENGAVHYLTDENGNFIYRVDSYQYDSYEIS